VDKEFEKELYNAVEVALDSCGIKPSWVMSHITPVIESFSPDQPICRCKINYTLETREYYVCSYCKRIKNEDN